ncbi:MAG: hypothetical protein LBC72_02450 [Spirochaetaceae bacterium]|nr:hypothetical protein [Spirochaetaceae bacterium]
MKKNTAVYLGVCFLLGAALFSGCETNRKVLPPLENHVIPQVEIKKSGGPGRFDPEKVPPEIKAAVKQDIVEYVNELNNIIRRRDFREWTRRLTPEYQKYLSSAENLERASQADRLKKNAIVLRSLYDYFIHVVVPSRDHDRVDDIEFLKEDRVKAYTIDRNQRRLRLYELVRSGETWLIVN